MTWTGLRPSGFGAVDGELMVDLVLLMADLVLLMADLVLLMVDYLLFFWIGVLFDEVLGWRFLGWRFGDFSRLVFSCWFGFDEFFVFWRFRWRIRILYEILHCSRFNCALALGLIVLGFGKNILVFLAKK